MASTEDAVIYQDVFEASPDPIMVHDADTGTVVRANQAAGSLLRCAPNDIVGMHVGEFSPPGFSTADANDLIAEAATSGSAQVEWATEGPDGTDQLVEVTLKRATLDDETRIVAFIHDVTDIRERERKHTEQSEQLTTLMENLPVVVFTLDPQGVFTYSAGKGLEGLGMEPGDLEGTSVFETHSEYPEILASTAAAALERVERGTRLKSKQAELKRSNEALQQFAYIASHDLQEPLRMVSSYVDLFDSEYGDALDEEAAECMAFAVDGAHRMQEMVDALLRDSRVKTKADDGDGMPNSEARRIFERGEKGSGSGGTGFGLCFVDTMVRSYGGDVWVEDSDLGGAFCLELPYATL